jgi:serine kinase of HPr protein (carbohydrate metabolism regulator)
MERVHATCVDIDGTGVLLRGPPGSGKSDLALRLIDGGARLVTDDRADLTLEGGRVVVTAPPEIAGLFEVRGQGVGRLPSVERAVLGLVVDLVQPERVERLPEAAQCRLLGLTLPLVRLAPFEASAAAKVRLAAAGSLSPIA